MSKDMPPRKVEIEIGENLGCLILLLAIILVVAFAH